MKFVFYNSSDGVYQLATETATISGGAIKQQWLLALTLFSKGHEVVFFTPSSPSKELIPVINGIRFLATPLVTTNFTLFRLLKIEKPDWLYWRTNSMHLGPCFFIAKRLGVSTIYACASDKDCNPRTALDPFSFRKYLWPLYHWGLKQADRIFVQHLGQLNLLANRFRTKARIVNNIAAYAEYTKKIEANSYIVWVGNLRFEKRPDILVEIAKGLPNRRFIVIGAALNYRSYQGYSQAVVQELNKLPNVEFLGAVSPTKTLEIVAGASIFLSTSYQEGFPNTMLEAWSMGVPVVSMKLDPGYTIITHNLGRVTTNIHDTINIMEKLIDDPLELMQLSENCKQYIQNTHSATRVYQQFIDAIAINKQKKQ